MKYKHGSRSERRLAATLYDQHDMSVRQVAAHLGRSYGAVWNWLTQANVQMRPVGTTTSRRKE